MKYKLKILNRYRTKVENSYSASVNFMTYRLIMSCLFLLLGGQVSGQDSNLNNYDSNKLNESKSLFRLKDEQFLNKYRHLHISAITGYQEGVESTYGVGNLDSYIDSKHGANSVYMFNLSKLDMLTFGFYKPNRVILEVEDPSKYCYDLSQGDKNEWMKKNAYCFEYIFPLGTMKNSKMLHDELSHFFNVEFGEEKRMIDVLLLVRTSNEDKMRSLGKGEESYNKYGKLNNIPIGRLEDLLNQSNKIVLNETGYKGNVDMNLNINSWNDLQVIRKSLQQYDLDLKPERREIMMFVIKEIK